MILSVLLPVYNAEKYVTDSIKSVLDQTFKDFELIIINDGSVDRSLELIKEFRDDRIVIIDQENRGLAKTLNRGLALSKGKYIARMDADDICMPHRFSEQIKYLEKKSDVGLLGAAVEVIDDNGKHLWYNPPLIGHDVLTKVMLTLGNPIKHPSVMFRKEIALRCGGYNEDIGKYFEDYMLWHLMSMQCKIDNIPKVLLKYRVTPSSIISTLKGQLLDDFVLKIIKKGVFDKNDKIEWTNILNSIKKSSNSEDRSYNSSTRGVYHKFIDLGYHILGDSMIKVLANLKKIKYL